MARGKLLQTTCKREYDLRTRNKGKYQQDIYAEITRVKKLKKVNILLAKCRGMRKLIRDIERAQWK